MEEAGHPFLKGGGLSGAGRCGRDRAPFCRAATPRPPWPAPGPPGRLQRRFSWCARQACGGRRRWRRRRGCPGHPNATTHSRRLPWPLQGRGRSAGVGVGSCVSSLRLLESRAASLTFPRALRPPTPRSQKSIKVVMLAQEGEASVFWLLRVRAQRACVCAGWSPRAPWRGGRESPGVRVGLSRPLALQGLWRGVVPWAGRAVPNGRPAYCPHHP